MRFIYVKSAGKTFCCYQDCKLTVVEPVIRTSRH